MTSKISHAAVVDAMLAKSSPLDVGLKNGTSPLPMVPPHGRAVVIDTLVEKGADPKLALKNGTMACGMTKDAGIKALLVAASG